MHGASFSQAASSQDRRMTTVASTSGSVSTVGPGDGHGLADANRAANRIKDRWRQGETPDVTVALASHPELRHYRSIVLDLAHAEYRLRLQMGESLDAETFSRRFPSLQKSLHLLIEVYGLLSQDPGLQILQDNLAWPEAGSRFLQFDLIAEIGRGAFGRVFLATEPALSGRQIVVKIAPHAGGEAEILARLHHPNIVPIYSLQEDTTTGLAAFCMPYVGRATLCDLLDESFANGDIPLHARIILDAIAAANDDSDIQDSPPAPVVLRRGSYISGVVHLASQLADALAHSHERGICHRDLKPSNVLITSEGRPLLLDFNLSVDTGLPAWKVGGTLPYMAPEELANLVCTSADPLVHSYDPRSDLFSLGVIVYELLTGTLPFGAIQWDRPLGAIADQLRQRQMTGPEPIRNRNRQVDRRLAHLVESCLAFEPEYRPETARHLATAFRHELSVVRRSSRWICSHRGLVLGLGAALLTLIFAAVAYLALRPPYSVRQLQRGLAFSKQGEYAQAVECLNDAVRANPISGEALLARGRAYHRLGEFQLAFKDYRVASQLAPSPIISACRGYCLSRTKYHKDAIAFYQMALEGGYDSPALLYNNIGVSHLMLGQVGDAEKSLERAIELDSKLQVARYNMVRLFLQRAVQGQPIPRVAFVHAARAIELGPGTADLYHRVAALYATSAKRDPTLTQQAIEYVGKAIELGFKPEAFTSDIRFAVLQKESAFRNVLRRPVAAARTSTVAQFVDPLDAL
jgi:eukaryotic-like serine/threonine-protein kinase